MLLRVITGSMASVLSNHCFDFHSLFPVENLPKINILNIKSTNVLINMVYASKSKQNPQDKSGLHGFKTNLKPNQKKTAYVKDSCTCDVQ